MAQEPVARDVCERMNRVMVACEDLAGCSIEGGHHLCGFLGLILARQSALERGGDDASTDWLGQDQHIAVLHTDVAQDVVGVNDANDGEAVLGFVVLYGVTTEQDSACCCDGVLSPVEDAAKDLHGQGVGRECDEVQCDERFGPHSPYVAERIGGGDTPEVVGIVDDGGEEVCGDDQSLIIVD